VISSDPCGAVQADSASPSDTDARPAGGVLGAFVELSKPGVGGLVITTTLCGALTAPVTIGLGRLIATLVGTSLVVAAANGLNMVIERKSDALMSRTRHRPLPTRRLSAELALVFCAVSSVVGMALLLAFVGNLAALLTLSALVSYVIAYTPLKRVTPLALFVGAVPGAIPPLIGWAAATGTLEPLAWLEFAVLYVWQLPHFLAIAIFRKDEYARAGMRVLSVSHGVRRSKIEIALYSLLLVVVSLLPVGLKLAGMAYAVVALTCGLAFLALATSGFSAPDDRRWARRVFFASMPYLVLVLGALAVFAGS
jgi:heme o synthase